MELLLPSPIPSFPWSKDVLLSMLLLLAPLLFYGICRAFEWIWWRPHHLRRVFESQGIPCLPAHFFFGNLLQIREMAADACKFHMPEITHNISPRLMPHLQAWQSRYGITSMTDLLKPTLHVLSSNLSFHRIKNFCFFSLFLHISFSYYCDKHYIVC